MLEKFGNWMENLCEDKPVAFVILCYVIGFFVGAVCCLAWYGICCAIDAVFKTNLKGTFRY